MLSLSRSSSTLFSVAVLVSADPVTPTVGVTPEDDDDVADDDDVPVVDTCSSGRPMSMTSPTLPQSNSTILSYLLVISMDALSLWTSQTRSNCDTRSPGDINHCSSSPSAMPSPMLARRKGTVVGRLLPSPYREGAARSGAEADVARAIALVNIVLVAKEESNARPSGPATAATAVVVVVVVVVIVVIVVFGRPRRTPPEDDNGDDAINDVDNVDDHLCRQSSHSRGEGSRGDGFGR
jgi:hypothetical protein